MPDLKKLLRSLAKALTWWVQLNTTVQFCLHWGCSRGSQINPNSMSFLSFLVGRSAFGKPYESLCTLIAIFLVLSLKTKTITSLCAGLLFASAMTWRSHGLGCNNGDEVPLWSDGNGFHWFRLAFRVWIWLSQKDPKWCPLSSWLVLTSVPVQIAGVATKAAWLAHHCHTCRIRNLNLRSP